MKETVERRKVSPPSPHGVCAVVGAQYGSEGKGVLVHHLANFFDCHVRVGGPNAGHSFVHEGRLWKMRSLPCGWTNPRARLVIGPGALVDLEVLQHEISEVERAGYSVRDRLIIDHRAGLITPADRQTAMLSESRQRYGSTQEGVGPARLRRLQRQPDDFQTAGDVTAPGAVVDTNVYLRAILQGSDVLLEGTQGCHLSLTHGPWPYVTSHDTNVGTLAADCGVAPSRFTQTILVARTYPIRVGGNSGPMRGREIEWEQLSQRIGRPVREYTTVTGRVRRLCEWNDSLLDEAIWLNGPSSLALMFLDYLFPADVGKTDFFALSSPARQKIAALEERFNVPIDFVGTGGETFAVIDRSRL